MHFIPTPRSSYHNKKNKINQRTVTKPNRTENQTERNKTDENKN